MILTSKIFIVIAPSAAPMPYLFDPPGGNDPICRGEDLTEVVAYSTATGVETTGRLTVSADWVFTAR